MKLTLNDTLTFGKYKGDVIQDVIKDDPDYLAWACDEIEWFDLDEEAVEALEIALWNDETYETYNTHRFAEDY